MSRRGPQAVLTACSGLLGATVAAPLYMTTAWYTGHPGMAGVVTAALLGAAITAAVTLLALHAVDNGLREARRVDAILTEGRHRNLEALTIAGVLQVIRDEDVLAVARAVGVYRDGAS